VGRLHRQVIAALILGLSLAGVAHAAPAQIESRYAPLELCRAIYPRSQEGGDRCRGYGGMPAWLMYMDANVSMLGFGRRENLSTGEFGLTRGANWPLEWRGVVARGVFKPFAVILRTRPPEGVELKAASDLVVFRLLPDGTSCIVGQTHEGDEAARAIADASRERSKCAPPPPPRFY
jgi:hypothetical protein